MSDKNKAENSATLLHCYTTTLGHAFFKRSLSLSVGYSPLGETFGDDQFQYFRGYGP